MAIRLALCDDSAAIRTMVATILGLEPDIEVVATGCTGHEAVALAAEHRPDVLLLDVAMPELDGIAAIPGVLAASPDTTIVMFSGFSSDTVRAEAEAAGAWRFVEKGSDMRVVAEAIRAAARVEAVR